MTENVLQARKDFSRFGFALFTVGIITTVLQLVVGIIWGAFFMESPLAEMEIIQWLLTMAPMYLIAVPIGLLMMKKIPAQSQEKQKLSFGRFWLLMLICMPVMYGGNYLGNILSSLLSGGSAENVLLDYIMGNPLYSFLFTVLLAPFMEEFLFRKQIIDRLGKYGEKTAILFSGITFGLFHLNLFQFFYAFGLGVIFAYVYTRTRMLRYPVIMHMVINFMGSVIAPLLLNMLDLELLSSPDTASLEQIMQMLPGLLAYLGYAFLLLGSAIAGLVVIIVRWNKVKFCPTSQELLPGSEKEVILRSPGMIVFTVFCLVMIVLALL
jgi:membrane protease YdiL (CAAX protease family)